MKKQCIYLLGIFLLLSLKIHAEDAWELIKEDKGIQIFSKLGDNSGYIEIKAVSEVKSSMESLVALMKDVDNFPDWMHAIEKTSLIDKTSDYDFSYYLHSDFPWPAKDRDVVISYKILRDPKTGAVYTKSHNITGVIPKKKNIQRIQSVNTSWKFIPVGNNRVKIVFQTRIKPSIQLPEWLANKVYHLGPYNTIRNMKDIIHEEKYQSATIDLNNI